MTDETAQTTRSAPRRALPNRGLLALAGAALLVLGGLGGAAAVASHRPQVMMAPVVPTAIHALANDRDAIVTVRGQVAEVYGNRFVIADASGRTLVETGRGGEDGTLVGAGQTVTVQGHYDRGFMHAAFLVGAGGKVTALGPMSGPSHGGCGPDGVGGPGRHGPHDRGPDDRGPGEPGMAPPPPPAAAPSAPAAAVTPLAAPAVSR